MKINVKEATVTSNVPQDNVTQMSISVDGMEHIMELLTNLYKDPELAVIREYYTNATDAHIAAGVDDPVLVTLPSWGEPNYKVQDFGVGMSEEDIRKIYAQYGASTKRNTNDQVGAFGLGCKSALTITQQFTLVSIKDGRKTTALIAKSPSGINTINIISNVETSEGNGTTVKIPVPTGVNDFNFKANQFFSFSAPGSVVVNGREPEYELSSATRVEDPNNPDREIYLKPRTRGESYVIMGNVPYALSLIEIEQSLARLNRPKTQGFISMPKYFPVPIGAVDLTPSREGLRFTDKTNEVIDAHISFLVNDLQQIAQDDIDSSTTLEEIYEKSSHWGRITDLKEMKWGDKVVPTSLKLSKYVRSIERNYGVSNHAEGMYINLYHITWGMTDTTARFLVKGLTADKYKRINPYLTPFMTVRGLESAKFFVTDAPEAFTDEWLLLSDNFTIIDSDDIIEIGREQRKKERAEAAKSGAVVKKGKITYPVLFVDDKEIRWVPYDEITSGVPYIDQKDVTSDVNTLIKTTYDYGTDRNISEKVQKSFQQVTDEPEIVLVSGGRTVKALTDRIKSTRNLSEDVKSSIKKLTSLITDDMVRHHRISTSEWSRFLRVSGLNDKLEDILDTDIKEVLETPKKVQDDYDTFFEAKQAFDYIQFIGPYSEFRMPRVEEVATDDGSVEELNKKYPLMRYLNGYGMGATEVDHLVKYLNVVHSESVSASEN